MVFAMNTEKDYDNIFWLQQGVVIVLIAKTKIQA